MEYVEEPSESMSMNNGHEMDSVMEQSTEYEDGNFESDLESDTEENGDDGSEEEKEYGSEGGDSSYCLENGIIMNNVVDVFYFDMKNILPNDVSRYDFGNLEVAYQFYSWYAIVNGFSVRKSKVIRNRMGEKVQQTFVCSRQGYREDRGLTPETRRHEQRPDTRCGCEAKFCVHIHMQTGRWYVTTFSDEHNHDLLEERYCSLLPAHWKISEADIVQINSFRKAGISAMQILAALVNNSGGYDRVGFRRKDLYNQLRRQRQEEVSDANGVVKYLRKLGLKDPLMYVTHTIDDDGRLKHLFWSDGESQLNYSVFGDVLAFDATYRKNKYLSPFVIFSGVNHHNQTIVFATALVCNDTEETYVWLLEQFLHVMKGKAPSSVITDGDVAMKNAIGRVFPNAHHRLCAWHLLRNASTKVANPDFMPYLKNCMLGDYDVVEFDQRWNEMVGMFELEDNTWITELYERRNMWATAHIRGNFFAGIRTTSRCEALHSHIRKYVHHRINLSEFVEQFQRCMTWFRFREVEADFQSACGELVLQTSLRCLERSASKQFTKEIFILFRSVLKKSSLIRIIDCQEMSLYSIFAVSKYGGGGTTWHVSFCPSTDKFTCSCLRMESIGLPCVHIVAVLVYLDFSEIPKSLILDRWSKCAKDTIRSHYNSLFADSQLLGKYVTMLHVAQDVCEMCYHDDVDYNHILELLIEERNQLKQKRTAGCAVQSHVGEGIEDTIHDPVRVRSKGCGRSCGTACRSVRWSPRCGSYGGSGHNRRSYTRGRQSFEMGQHAFDNSCTVQDIGLDHDGDDSNTEMLNEDDETFMGSTSGAVESYSL